MRVLIAGADMKTLRLLRTYLTGLGHDLEITTNGLACMAGLRGFSPDLLVMEIDILWGGCDGVISIMNDEPRLKRIPVVLFTEKQKQQALKGYPRIIAMLNNPFQPRELFRLRYLLEDMDSARTIDSSIAKRFSQVIADGAVTMDSRN